MHKFIPYAVVLLGLALNVQSKELADNHKGLCEIPEIRSLMANADACRVILSPGSLVDMSGTCTGETEDKNQCTFVLKSQNGLLEVSADCTSSEETEDDEEDESEEETVSKTVLNGFSYKASAVVTDKEGNDHIFTDGNTYSVILNSIMGMWIVKEKKSGPIKVEFMGLTISNVKCI